MASRKAHRPTSRSSEQVELLVAAGVKKEAIARVIGCTLKELEKHYTEELELGLDTANAKVIRNLFNIATSNSRQAVSAAALWLKNRADWKDKSTHELTGPDGRPIEHTQIELDAKTLDKIRRKYIGDDESD